MTVTKTHLTSSIHNRLDIPKSQASRLIESLLENIKRTLASGEDILISGFGKFCVKDKKGVRLILRSKPGKMTVDEKRPEVLPAIAQDEGPKCKNSLAAINGPSHT